MNAKLYPTHKLFLLLMALMVVLSGLGLTAQPAQAATCAQYHTVQKGEYLGLIAQKYNTSWQKLAEINNLKDPSLIFAGQKLCIAAEGSVVIPNTGATNGSTSSNIPGLTVLAVDEDRTVTVQGYNFPRQTRVDVRLDEIGTRAEKGILVGSATTDRNGTFEATFEIPRDLRGDSMIAIRLEAPTGHFSYNWFFNEDFEAPRGGPVKPGDKNVDDNGLSTQVDFDEEIDLYRGNAGMYTAKANFSGWLQIVRQDAAESNLVSGIRPTQDLVELSLWNKDSKRLSDEVRGLNYVYFNLTAEDRAAYDDGDLAIYHYNTATHKWVASDIQLLIKTENKPHGRLAAVVQDLGLYALAR